jgi:hypothetical protein
MCSHTALCKVREVASGSVRPLCIHLIPLVMEGLTTIHATVNSQLMLWARWRTRLPAVQCTWSHIGINPS